MKAIMTVVGADRVGIIAGISATLAELNVNIVDLSQTIMDGIFTMTMMVDTAACTVSFEALRAALMDRGTEMNLTIRIQRTDIFTAMHRI